MEWGSKVRLGNPSPREAWTALHTNISARLKYPVPACTLTELECKSIMSPAIRAALPKAGIVSTMETAMRDGPISSLGCGVLSLYHFMGTSRTAFLVEHLAHDTPLGIIFRINIEDLVVDSGRYGNLWDMNVEKIKKYVSTHSWMFHTIEYNFSHNISISCPHMNLKPQRKGDRSIMALSEECFGTTTAMRSINRVRMQFQVTHLSDISMANGRGLNVNYIKDMSYKAHRNNLNWPTKHHVTSADFRCWKKLIRWIFPLTNHLLYTPLLEWSVEGNWNENWDWFTSTEGEFLFHQITDGVWHRHLKIKGRHRSYHLQYMIFNEFPENTHYRASIHMAADSIRLLNTSSPTNDSSQEEEEVTSFDVVSISAPKVNWFMHRLKSSDTTSKLLSSLIDGSALGVSDGSYFPQEQVGSCAWILASSDGSEWIEGGGIIPGPKLEQSSYRSELGGQTGLSIVCSNLILPPVQKKQKHITLLCDGLSALETVGRPIKQIKVKHKHSDLISITSSVWNSTNFKITTEHVRAHQDDTLKELTIPEILNCRMDTLAKDIATTFIQHRHSINFAPSSLGFGTVTCNGVIIGSRLQHTLYNSILHAKIVTRLSILLHIPESILHDAVNWRVLSTARKEARLQLKIFITKWISKDTATGVIMVQRKKRLHSNCPLCHLPNEDTLHVLQCQSSSATSHRTNLLAELTSWLKSVDTHPDITTYINTGLSNWFNCSPHTLSRHNLDPVTFTAFLTQQSLGWEAFLHGMIAAPIITLQQKHYSTSSSRKTGTRWGINLVSKTWNIIHQLWIHRNSNMHETEAINQMSGKDNLIQAIVHECTLGLKDLPPVYSTYFTSLSSLLSKPIAYQKQWFLVIRSGRESCITFQHYDKFSTEPSLRSWIGLSSLN